MFIKKCNMTHRTAKQPLVQALQKYAPFHTRRGKITAEYMASARYNKCPDCYEYTLYTVYSYYTTIFQYCTHCNKMKYYNEKYYGSVTTTLQRSIIAAFPDLALHDPIKK